MIPELHTLSDSGALTSSVGSTPDPEVTALPKRRRFSAAYKRHIVRAALAAGPGLDR